MAPTETPDIRVVDIDHIVLNVSDVERSLRFYIEELGLEPVRVEEWRRGEVFFPSVRISPTAIIDLLEASATGTNVDHFCLVIQPTDLEALKASGRFDVVDGPDVRFGARGDGMSLYVRDPDGNVVELRYYEGERFVNEVASMGESRVNLDRALQVAADLEDDELVRRMRAGS